MDNKLSELSKPVATVDVQRGRPDANMFGVAWSSAGHALPDGPHFLYSQEYVSALLSQIEADREIKARLCRESNSLHERLKAAEKRIAELEAKLATPVRLLGEMLLHDWEHSVERQAAFEHRKTAWDARLEEDKKAISSAGFTFTVEGDE